MRWAGLLLVVALTVAALVVMTTRDQTDDDAWQPQCHAMPEYACAQQHWQFPERTTP